MSFRQASEQRKQAKCAADAVSRQNRTLELKPRGEWGEAGPAEGNQQALCPGCRQVEPPQSARIPDRGKEKRSVQPDAKRRPL
jgi:hypothetical protein